MVPSIEVLPTGSLKLYKSMQAFEFNPRGMIAASHGPEEGMHSYQVRSCGTMTKREHSHMHAPYMFHKSQYVTVSIPASHA